MTDFKVEEKYLVIKRSDLDKFFSQYPKRKSRDWEQCEPEAIDCIPFSDVLKGIQKIRENDERNPHPRYWVCNQDEPYADMIIRLIELGERAKPQTKGINDKEV